MYVFLNSYSNLGYVSELEFGGEIVGGYYTMRKLRQRSKFNNIEQYKMLYKYFNQDSTEKYNFFYYLAIQLFLYFHLKFQLIRIHYLVG